MTPSHEPRQKVHAAAHYIPWPHMSFVDMSDLQVLCMQHLGGQLFLQVQPCNDYIVIRCFQITEMVYMKALSSGFIAQWSKVIYGQQVLGVGFLKKRLCYNFWCYQLPGYALL